MKKWIYNPISLSFLDHADADPEPIIATDQENIPNEDGNKTDCDLEPVPVPELDPEVLAALGEATEEAPKFGPKIQENLSRLWTPLLQRGLNKETRDKLNKEYPIPENCPLLQAPKLNPEIAAAVSDSSRHRDKKVESVQQQLGRGITALNKGLELLLDESKDRLLCIKFLSDSCRLLCDLHHSQTETRKNFVIPGLDKSFLNIMQDVNRDEMLFGNKLSDKIKATKVIEKHGLQIKKSTVIPKKPSASTSYQPSTSRSRPQGNWGGPPRFSSNRGGRGGPKKNTLPSRKLPVDAIPTKSPAQNKRRATHQQ